MEAHFDIQRQEDGDRLIEMRVTWDARPGSLARIVFNFAIAPACLWILLRAQFEHSSYLVELAGKLLIGLIGMLAPYLALVELVNTTTVTLNMSGLAIRHGPIPCPPFKRDIPLSDLTAVRSIFVTGDDEPGHSVRVITTLREYPAFNRLPGEDAASILAALDDGIDQLQRQLTR